MPEIEKVVPTQEDDHDWAALADQGAIDAARALSGRDCGASQADMRQARRQYLATVFARHRLNSTPHPVARDGLGIGEEEVPIDDLVMIMLARLHANVPEDQRPMGFCDLSDEQAERAREAVRAILLRLSLASLPASPVNVGERAKVLLRELNSIASDQRFSPQGRHDKQVETIERALSIPDGYAKQQEDQGVAASLPGHQPSASAPSGASQSGVPNAGDTYRGWSIHQGRWPEPAWMATSPDYDAWTEGEGEWADNGQKADSPTYDGLIAAIDEWFEENGQFGVGA